MTTERIDHAAEAARILESGLEPGNHYHPAVQYAQAQVHATLALAEQARIANLVSMWSEDSSGYVEAALVEKVDGKWKLRPDIAAALGLSDD